MDTRKLTGNLGAELTGIDLSLPISDETAAALRYELGKHHVIVMRDQHLSVGEQKAVTMVFGELTVLPYVEPMAEDELVIAVLKEVDEVNSGVFGGDWHSDFSFLENPPAGSVLSAVELPPVGGDTLWSNQVLAYATLPDHLTEIVDKHQAVHLGAPYGVANAPPPETQANGAIRMRRGDPNADREMFHPAVITSPDTGDRSLFLNPIYTTRFDGMTEAESAPYLDEIYRHCVRPDFGIRHTWHVGDLVIWNNRTTLHFATNDYDGHRRLLYRTTFRREAPR